MPLHSHGETTRVAHAKGLNQTVRRALWPWLVVFALVAWLVDVLLRRVRLFERGEVPA